jgi:hypothetical protein
MVKRSRRDDLLNIEKMRRQILFRKKSAVIVGGIALMTTTVLMLNNEAKAHHVLRVRDPGTSQQLCNELGYPYCSCVETYLAEGYKNIYEVDLKCSRLARRTPSAPTFNPYHNPYSDFTIQAPDIRFGF